MHPYMLRKKIGNYYYQNTVVLLHDLKPRSYEDHTAAMLICLRHVIILIKKIQNATTLIN